MSALHLILFACVPLTVCKNGKITIRTREQIVNIGLRLYDKVHNVLPGENRFFPALIESITQDDCIDFIHNLVIDRQYEGYLKEHGR